MGWLLLAGFLVSAVYVIVRLDHLADRLAWWWIDRRDDQTEREWLRFNDALRGDPWR